MLNVPHRSVFACDSSPAVEKFIKAFDKPDFFVNDCLGDEHKRLPRVHFYMAGFPCQPYSVQGSGLGMKCPANGNVLHGVLAYIRTALPDTFCLENVEGLVRRHRKVLNLIVGELTSIKSEKGEPVYNVTWKVLDSTDATVPQRRRRLFIVGIAKARDSGFAWPVPLTHAPLKAFLSERRKATDLLPACRPPASQTTANKNLDLALETIRGMKYDPFKHDILIDIDGVKPQISTDVAMCLTKRLSSGGGPWVTSRGRRTTVQELCRLQGASPGPIIAAAQRAPISPRQLYEIIGNAITVPLLARVIAEIFKAAKLYNCVDLGCDDRGVWGGAHYLP
jgi:DNA-cytosine methyltransferase